MPFQRQGATDYQPVEKENMQWDKQIIKNLSPERFFDSVHGIFLGGSGYSIRSISRP
jgi:hypothetical protein